MAKRDQQGNQPRTQTATEEELVRVLYSDLKYSHAKSRELHEEMINDTRFAQGEQWSSGDLQELESRGVKGITVNKIKPMIKLLIGIERQSKTDYKVLPEGDEDSITAEIVNRLVKNVVKNSRAELKMSESFKSGVTTGMSFIEPYIDYTFDLVNGDLKFKKISGQNVFLDPDFEEYDLSDCRYVIKVNRSIEKNDLLALFPDDKKKVEGLDINGIGTDGFLLNHDVSSSTDGDYDVEGEGTPDDTRRLEVPTYDLIERYYKSFEKRYYVYFEEKEEIKEFVKKENAEEFAAQFEQFSPQVLEREVNVIKLMQVVGETIFYNDLAPTYPRWKTYPLIPFFAELSTDGLKDMNLKIQGVVRGIKDLNIEYNKRRTQELNILNTSQNSGFWIQDGSMHKDEEARLKKLGSSPGFVGKYKKGYDAPTRIQPMALSQGHAQLAIENAQDLKEASGVNPDLLANDSQSQSGRAILLKQRQGLVMVQEILDNYGITKQQVGKYIISQLPEIMTVKSAMRILGSAFIAENFETPVNVILERGLAKVEAQQEPTELEQQVMLQYSESNPAEPIVDENNQLVTVTDTDTAEQVVNLVLTNSEMGKYDIAIGEGPFQETIAMANFTDLKELAQQGVMIPPQDLVQESMLPDANKKRIIANLAAQAQMAQAQPAE